MSGRAQLIIKAKITHADNILKQISTINSPSNSSTSATSISNKVIHQSSSTSSSQLITPLESTKSSSFTIITSTNTKTVLPLSSLDQKYDTNNTSTTTTNNLTSLPTFTSHPHTNIPPPSKPTLQSLNSFCVAIEELVEHDVVFSKLSTRLVHMDQTCNTSLLAFQTLLPEVKVRLC